MEYYKNFSLESLFYINDEGLVCQEEWRDIPDYEGYYQVSDLGRIKSLSRIKMNSGKNPFLRKEIMMKQNFNPKGYLSIFLCKNSEMKIRKIHKLVAIAFLNHIPCGYDLVINHKNFIKTDNIKGNLEIITARENSNLKHIKSSSKFVGVSWHKKVGKWQSRIVINKKRIHLGVFNNEIDAHNAYQNKLAEIN